MRQGLGVMGALLMLTGCSGSAEPVAAPPTVTQTVTATVAVTHEVEVTETVTVEPSADEDGTESDAAESTGEEVVPSACEPRETPQDEPYASHSAQADLPAGISVITVQATTPHSTHPDRKDRDLIIYICSEDELSADEHRSAATAIARSLHGQEGSDLINQLYVSTYSVSGGALVPGPKTKVPDYQLFQWNHDADLDYAWDIPWS